MPCYAYCHPLATLTSGLPTVGNFGFRKAAGFEVAKEVNTLPVATYEAAPKNASFVWNLSDVLAAMKSGEATFVDTRSLGEYSGETLRDNAKGGHIPGAVGHDFAVLLTDEKCVVDPATAARQLATLDISKDKMAVLYCQTATRVSLNYLVMKDLGYDKVAIYDASWHEYGNTPECRSKIGVP